MKPGIVLLAAGGSSRMGRPKQLLDIGGKKLIQVVIERLLACEGGEVHVVLGAHRETIAPYCAAYPVRRIENPDWETGMAGSLRVGVASLGNDITHALICLVDQPRLEAQHYRRLLEGAREHPEQVVAAYYDGQPGVPACFPRQYFHLLMRGEGDRGARKWIRELGDAVLGVEMEEAGVDWDRLEDVDNTRIEY